MTATMDAEEWLYTTLSGDETLTDLISGIYSYIAPDAAAYPFLVYKYLDGEDEPGVGTARLFSRLEYAVVGVDSGESFSALDAIADQIDTLLHAKQGATPDGGLIVDCIRLRPLANVEVAEGGLQIRQLGGVYQIRVQEDIPN
jgi:hypothetical protein